MAERERRLFQSGPILMRLLRDGGSLIIPNRRIQSGDRHQRLIQMFFDYWQVRFNANRTVIIKCVTGVGNELYGLEQIVNHNRLEDVKLKVPLRTAKGDS